MPVPAGVMASFNFMISTKVVTNAMAMPAMPKLLSRRAVDGCDSLFNA